MVKRLEETIKDFFTEQESDPGGWKAYGKSAPEIAKSGRELSRKLLPGYSAAEKAAQGDLAGAGKDLAIDALAIGTGVVAGKAIGAIARNPVKSTVGAAALSTLAGGNNTSIGGNVSNRTTTQQSGHIAPKTSVISTKAKVRRTSKPVKPISTKEETEAHKRNIKAQKKLKVIDERFLKESIKDVLTKMNKDSKWVKPKDKKEKDPNVTDIILNPTLKSAKDQ